MCEKAPRPAWRPTGSEPVEKAVRWGYPASRGEGLVQPQGGLAPLWPGPGLCQRGVTGATESCSQTYCSPWMPLVFVLSVTVIIFNCASNLTVHSSWGRGFYRRIPITGWLPSRRRTVPKEQTVSFRLVQWHRRRKALSVLILTSLGAARLAMCTEGLHFRWPESLWLGVAPRTDSQTCPLWFQS